ncbi:MAG: hypothetical protein O3C28_10965 [Proteobacteria bacterium]|nr:hypothetical protein [Pseudomonadota bacterium]
MQLLLFYEWYAALERTVRCADGWLPMGIDPSKLAPRIAKLKELAEVAGKACPDIVLIGALPDDQTQAVDQLAQCAELGATDYIQASRYNNEQELDQILVRLADLKRQMA